MKRERFDFAGSIQKLHLVNFLSHENLELEFSRVNFVNGHNGCGKSACLAAIIIALGGKASLTGRGKNLRDLIKYAKPYSIIKLTLSNQGQNSYLEEKLGNFIQIERKITPSSSNIKISGQYGRYSDKKCDLEALKDHFNIQVDNVLVWLTQDMAKEFLMSASPKDLYSFFSLGADIDLTKQMYEETGSQLLQTSQKLELVRNSISLLRKKRNEKAEVFEKLNFVDKLRQKIKILKLAEDYCRLNDDLQEVNIQNQKILNLKNDISQINDEKHKVNGRVTSLQEMVSNDAQQQLLEVQNELEDLKQKQHILRKRKQDCHNGFKIAKEEYEQAEKDSKILSLQIETASKEMSMSDLQQNQQWGSRKQELEKKNEQITLKINNLSKKQDNLIVTEPLEEGLKDLNFRIENLEKQLMGYNRARENKLNTWGQNVSLICEDLKKIQWLGFKPIGPIGCFCKPRDLEFILCLRSILGPSMKDFIVQNHKDRIKLEQLFKKYNHSARILICNDVSELNLLVPDQKTILQSMDIQNKIVKKTLVINLQIERIVLCRSLQEAEFLTRNGYPKYVVAVYIPSGFSVGSKSGARAMNAPQIWKGSCPFGIQQTNNLKQELDNLKHQRNEKQDKLKDLKQKKFEFQKQQQKIDDEINRLDHERSDNLILINNITLNTQNTSIGYFTQMENDFQTALNKVTSLEVSLPIYQIKLDELTKDLEKNSFKISSLQQQEDEIKNQISKMNEKMANVERDSKRFQHQLHNLDLKIQSESKKLCLEEETLHQLQLQVSHKQQRLQDPNLEEQDREMFDQMILYSMEEHKKNLSLLNVRLKCFKSEIPVNSSHEKAKLDLDEAVSVYQEAKNASSTLVLVRDNLQTSLQKRMQLFMTLVNQISAQARNSFRIRMRKRGYQGDIIFDHSKKTLLVQADSKSRNMATYSGGEKSFTTVCLLLSLWDAMPSPIRCMDEFDVYMDEINRTISMELLMEAAFESSESQFVFITPLSLTKVQNHPHANLINLD